MRKERQPKKKKPYIEPNKNWEVVKKQMEDKNILNKLAELQALLTMGRLLSIAQNISENSEEFKDKGFPEIMMVAMQNLELEVMNKCEKR